MPYNVMQYNIKGKKGIKLMFKKKKKKFKNLIFIYKKYIYIFINKFNSLYIIRNPYSIMNNE